MPTQLSVHNPNSKPVAYKVKVTAPKSYVVKPNSGRIEPGETVNVQGEPLVLRILVKRMPIDAPLVILQPMKEEPAINAKSRDKFLLQSCIINVEQEGRPLHDLVCTCSLSVRNSSLTIRAVVGGNQRQERDPRTQASMRLPTRTRCHSRGIGYKRNERRRREQV